MDNTPIKLENILEQAPNWTFAGDFTLLQWMTQISEVLETGATKTTDALNELQNNIKCTNIALDNVANSLTSLQFGNQFVEYRVQDDDETLNNINEGSTDICNTTELTPTSKELLNTFLDNNLKVLRNCHEKYSIDLDDSDDDDENEGKSKEKTCIYQPINPYNERPLPFIFGSKEWHANWHVGLYENQQENSYSGDEVSEVFSESSSSSRLDDNESFESNTEWASNNSVDSAHLNTNIENRNASSLRGSQPLYPATPNIPINAPENNNISISGSSSFSPPASPLTKKSIEDRKLNEHQPGISESINSTESKNSRKTLTKVPSYNTKNSSSFKVQPPSFIDLFAEPPEDIKSTTSSVSSAQNVKNIPDGDGKLMAKSVEKPSNFRFQTAPFVDLFAEPPEDIASSTKLDSVSSSQNTKRKIVNLFDDDKDNDVGKNDLLSDLTKKEEYVKPKNDVQGTIPILKTNEDEKALNISKMPKSLFEDSEEEEDDFLRTFVNKSSTKEISKSTLTKSLLFDNDVINVSPKSTDINENTNNIFDDIENNEKDISFSKKENTRSNLFDDIKNDKDELLFNKNVKEESRNVMKNSIQGAYPKPIKPSVNEKKSGQNSVKENMEKSANLFDSFEKTRTINNSVPDKDVKNLKKLNLFDDLDDGDGDGDDLFSTKPTSNQNFVNMVKTKNKETKTLLENPIKSLKNSNEIFNEQSEENLFKENATESSSKMYNLKRNDIADESYNDVRGQNISSDSEIKKSDTLKMLQTGENKLPSREAIFESDSESLNDQLRLANKELNINEIVSALESKSIDSLNKPQNPNPANKYEFNSILFNDEPPEDDSEFFEALTKTQTTNSNNAVDLENDLYEPELLKISSADANNSLTDTPDNRQMNLYTGLQLFSDIPPDDDDLSADIDQTKRLQVVFYDDFDETLEALNKNQISKGPLHSIFSNEPPPINEELNLVGDKDTSNHTINDVEKEINLEDTKLKEVEITSKFEDVNVKSVSKNNAPSTNFSISKLQMPNINIKVQALLPGANSNLCKPRKEIKKSNEANEDNLEPVTNFPLDNSNRNETITVPKKEIPVYSRTAETEHILPSVTKNRVRAPATRRPSSRKVRQENYRKSLIEEQKISDIVDKFSENHQKYGDQFKNISDQLNESISDIFPHQINVSSKIGIIGDNTKTKDYSDKQILIKDNNTSLPNLNKSIVADCAILGAKNDSKNQKEELPKELENSSSAKDNNKPQSIQITDNEEIEKNLHFFNPTKNAKKQTQLLLFEDDDDDLFKYIKAAKTKNVKEEETLNVPDNQYLKTTEKHSEVSKKILSPFQNVANIEVTNEAPQPIIVDNNAAPIATTLKHDSDTKQFLGFVMPSDTKNIQTKTEISNETLKSTLNNTASSFFDDEDDVNDDLFNSTTIYRSINQAKLREISKAKSQFKSFLDSESEEEPNLGGSEATTSTISSIKTQINPSTTNKNSNTKLFTDSDTDSDDLFGKLSSSKALNNTKISNKISTESASKISKSSPQSSLFSDGSDDNDFLKISEISNKKLLSKRCETENKVNVGTRASTSLFSDIDSDEDDLFGSGAVKSITAGIPSLKTSMVSKSKTVINNLKINKATATTMEISKSTTVADNPLADLL